VGTESLGSSYPSRLATELAERLRSAREELVQRWLDRISSRVAISSKSVFPTDELLNHVPLLIEGIAGYLERPDNDIDSEAPVVAKAMELGALRHEQGFDAYEILKEHEILGAIVFAFLGECAEQLPDDFPRRDFLACWQRISQAIELIRQATMSHFLRLSAEEVNDREERLRKFNRTVAHELKNKVHAIKSASSLLAETWVSGGDRKELDEIIAKNADGLKRALANLESISRAAEDSRHGKHVLLPEAASEAVRELRDAAQSRGIDVRIADLPEIEVDAATVELCLMNYVSNAIKYSDPGKSERWVAIEAAVEPGPKPTDSEIIIRVCDNGIGVPADRREQLFQEFYRAHGDTVTDVDGSGLGLSIVRETLESVGGRAWAEFPDDAGSVFAFALPARRRGDSEAAERGPADSPTPEK
jgi:signal transduction histidine kinase